MTLPGFKNRFSSPLSLLLLWSIALRVIVYLLLPVSDDFGKYTYSGPLFFSALQEHFGDYLSFTTNIPPGTFLIDALVIGITGAKTAMAIRSFLILVSIMDIVALFLLWDITGMMGADKKTSFWAILLYSTALIPFELWHNGMHYDHPTLFLTTLFLWSLVRLFKNETGISNWIWISVTGALLVSQSAVNSAIVPFTILFFLLIVYFPKKKYGKLVLAVLITLSLPVTVLKIISNKNQKEGQESLTSNKAGPAMMMVVQRAYQYDVNKVRAQMQSAEAPDWYLWTYDHATVPVDPLSGKPYKDWINLSQAFGICFFSHGKEYKGPWAFDFDPLIQYLESTKKDKLLQIVKEDAADAVEKPYRYAGFSPELSPRWIGVYGDISKKIFFATIRDHPVGMLKAFAAQQGIFAIYGPLFTFNTTQSSPSLFARSGVRTSKETIPLSFLFIPVTLVFAVVSWVTYLLMLMNIPVFIWQFLKSLRPGKKLLTVDGFLLVSVPAICVAVIFSCLVGGENDRYFMQVSPYIIVLACLLPARWRSLTNQAVV